MPKIEQSILDQIQPVVLVGGQSERFGRDKLMESVDGKPLVGRPIDTLRAVFGNRVAVVGRCDERIGRLGDRVIGDPYPGIGPVGGICAALEGAGCDLFVCAGDLLAIDAATIELIVTASIEEPGKLAYIARTDRNHPTIGLYRAGCKSYFKDAIREERLKLGMVLDREMIGRIMIEPGAARNINHPGDLS